MEYEDAVSGLPQTDDYDVHIAEAVKVLLTSGPEAGRTALEPIAYPPRELPRRPTLTRAQAGRIYVRDHFVCRYCGQRTILSSIMELIGRLYPDIFSFHPNWKGGVTHPAFATEAPQLIMSFRAPGAVAGPRTRTS